MIKKISSFSQHIFHLERLIKYTLFNFQLLNDFQHFLLLHRFSPLDKLILHFNFVSEFIGEGLQRLIILESS